MSRFLLAILMAGLASAATAGEGYICEGDGVNIHVPLGGSIGLAPLGVVIDAGGEVYATDASLGAPIVVSQAMAEGNKVMIDFTDVDYATLIAKIRIFWAEEESDPVYGGVLSIVGKGAWAITCGVG
jgi:hypothetical protein